MKRLVHTSLAGLLVLAACGSDGPSFGPETAPTPVQQSAITSTEQGLVVLAAAETQGAATAGAAFGFASSSMLLVAPSSARVAIVERVFPVVQAPFEDCAVIGETSVSWTNCTEEGFTIDGSVSWGPGHVEVDVTISGSIQGLTFEYQVEGAITVTASSIEGDMTISGTATAGGMSLSQRVHSEIDVEIAQGCITSGTLTVEVSGTGSVNGAAQVIWSGCHTAQIRNA